jgi:DNA-binding NtrC family response regulator
MMPDLDGPHAYDQISAVRPGVPVIFSSGYTPEAVPFIAAIGRGTLVLQKPYTLKSLSQTIRTALDGPVARRASALPSEPASLKSK